MNYINIDEKLKETNNNGKNPNSVLIIGCRRYGKTTLVKKIANKIININNIDENNILIISKDELVCSEYSEYNKAKIIYKYDNNLVKPNENNKPMLIIIDDILHETNLFYNDNLKNIIINGSRLNVYLIVAVQYGPGIPSMLRARFDLIFYIPPLGNKYPDNIINQRMYSSYYDIFFSYDEFINLIKKLENRNVIVYDNFNYDITKPNTIGIYKNEI